VSVIRRAWWPREARDARAVVEFGLDAVRWKWSPRLSYWIDYLLVLEERA